MLEGIKDEEFSVYVNLQGRLTVMLAVPTDIIGDSFDLTISTLGPVAGDEDVIREEGIVAFRRVIEVVSDWLEES